MTEPPYVGAFQARVAEVFFSLPEADSFLLAGGLALVAHGLTDRPTEDLDAFTCRDGDVSRARSAFEKVALAQGWQIEELQSSETFVRLRVIGEESLLVDIALDSPPGLPSAMTILGPTFAPAELAARKLLALADRAMPRDFADVYALRHLQDRDAILAMAQSLDPGLTARGLADAMRQLDRYADEDIPVGQEAVARMRSFFREWIAALA